MEFESLGISVTLNPGERLPLGRYSKTRTQTSIEGHPDHERAMQGDSMGRIFIMRGLEDLFDIIRQELTYSLLEAVERGKRYLPNLEKAFATTRLRVFNELFPPVEGETRNTRIFRENLSHIDQFIYAKEAIYQVERVLVDLEVRFLRDVPPEFLRRVKRTLMYVGCVLYGLEVLSESSTTGIQDRIYEFSQHYKQLMEWLYPGEFHPHVFLSLWSADGCGN